jgi:chemotaxis protein methyltransferase CheR
LELSSSSNISPKELYEVKVVLECIRRFYGFDFTDYQKDSLIRRIRKYVESKDAKRISDILGELLYNPSEVNNFLQQVLVGVTEMFREPEAFKAVKKHLVPYLRTFPFTNVWHVGCSTGEEVYSMAILLKEEKLLERTQLYGTDINTEALDFANKGIYPGRLLPNYSQNYVKFEGRYTLSKYIHSHYQHFKMKEELIKHAVFSRHNLTIDGVFTEAQLICCRNVLIYFNRELQNRVLKVIYNSLGHRGYLWLGDRETLHLTEVEDLFELVDIKARLYRKKFRFT